MLKTIEIKLIDNEGNYSIAYVDYKGYVDTFKNHGIDMVHDALVAMEEEFDHCGRLQLKKSFTLIEKDVMAEHEAKGAPHKH